MRSDPHARFLEEVSPQIAELNKWKHYYVDRNDQIQDGEPYDWRQSRTVRRAAEHVSGLG